MAEFPRSATSALSKLLALKALHLLLVLLAVSALSFTLIQSAPGDFFSDMRLNPQLSAETLAALRHQYALDAPPMTRYSHWLASALRGDLGFSFAYNRPVAPLLWERALNTLLLTTTSLLVAWAIAIPLGTWSASKCGRWQDAALSSSMGALHTVPDVLFALIFLMFVARTGILPSGGMRSTSASDMSHASAVLDVIRHMVLPVAALVLATVPTIMRHVRGAVVEVLGQPFVKVAEAAGIPKTRILWRHVLPVAANPLISLFGLSIAGLLSSSLLVEFIVGWPGLGPLMLDATFARDFYVVIGSVMASTVLLLVGTLVVDVMLRFADPRLRVPYREST